MSDGYGLSPFGLDGFGSIVSIPPEITDVASLDGCRVRVSFNVPMAGNAALTATSSYTVTALLGAAVTVQSVQTANPSNGGFLAVDLTVSGTTLGGLYTVIVSGPENLTGQVLAPPYNSESFLALGQVLTTDVAVSNGSITITVKDDLDREVSLLDNGAVQDDGSYTITGDYPISPSVNGAGFSSGEITLEVGQLTTISYDGEIGPAEALSYDGTVLPNLAVGFDGVEIGTGSSSIVSGSLLLSKPVSAVVYGWQFEDTSGKLTASASFQAVFSIDATATSGSPRFVVSDGVSQIDVTLDTSGPIKEISIEAGGFSSVMEFDWSASIFELTVIRNSQASLCTVLIDGIPFDSFSDSALTQPAIMPAGAGVFLDAGLSASGLKVSSVVLQASETIYTAAWNFVFNLVFGFVGLSGLANDRIRTKRGPLVKSWGDWTPAGPNDVEVRVNGVPVAIADVNPYTGEIFPVVPIPLFPAGMATVEVDYCWIVNPIFALSGLNTTGLTLNNWGRANGHTALPPPVGPPGGVFGLGPFGFIPFGAGPPIPALPPVAYGRGVQNTMRFPYSTVLGPLVRPEPKRIGHTYIGYQRDYSALTNDPTTLLLNNNPHAISNGQLTAASVRQTGRFTGTSTPANQGWLLTGADAGFVVGDGSYQIVDANAGDYPDGTASLYYKNLDLALPTIVQASARFKGIEVGTYDGVFSGLAFGTYDGRRLIVIGALLVDGVQHFGLLLDGNRPDLEASWQIGPSATATATSQNTLTVTSAEYAVGLGYGSRFRVAGGAQAGIYTISSCGIVAQTNGGIELTFTPALPTNINLFGGGQFTIYYETPWLAQDLNGVRAIVDFPNGTVTAYLSGRISGTIGSVQAPAYPAETGLLIPASISGGYFFGSISRRAANKSAWDLAQYAANPVALTQTVSGVYVTDDMTVLPEDASDPWFITGGYGAGSLSLGELVLSSSARSSALDFEFGYSRVEPHLTNKVTTNFLATTTVDTATLGAGDIALRIRDGAREVRLVNLLYKEPVGFVINPQRSLVTDLPSNFLSGLQALEDEGWVSNGVAVAPIAWGQSLGINKPAVLTPEWTQTVPASVACGHEGAVLTARFSAENLSGVATPYIAARVKTGAATARYVRAVFGAGGTLTLTNELGVVKLGPIAGVTWTDGDTHEYRIVCDPTADLVTVFVDNALAGSVALSLFSATTTDFTAIFGVNGAGSVETEWYEFTVVPLRPIALVGSTIHRTFGIWLGGDVGDINNYVIPRSDNTNEPNSSLFASPVTMDWTTTCELRLYVDPTWGASFYRPDLPLPPTSNAAGYTTETVNPTDAWINVEYRRLPRQVQARGEISFGSLDPKSVSRSRWDDVSYRVRARPYGYGIAQTGMVLNRAITFKSGDWNLDATPEVRLIPARDTQSVFVNDSAINGDRVFLVRIGGVTIPAAGWQFDSATQEIRLANPVAIGTLVEVTFAPARPQTKTYQCSRPIDETVTVLNAGTPPVPMSRDGAITRSIVATPNGDEVQFSYDQTSLYASVDFCQNEVGDDVPLTSICDGAGPGLGLAEIAIEGRFTTDPFTVLEGPAGPFRGSPTFRGSAMHFGGVSLIAAGGRRPTPANGVLNSAITYPNARGPSGQVPVGGFGMNQDFALYLRDVQDDTWDLPASMGDNVPPSAIGGAVNPDGTPGVFGNGACVAQIIDYASTGTSRLGPWGGLPSLTPRSLLAGGAPLPLSAFTLVGGAPLPSPTITTVVLEAAN